MTCNFRQDCEIENHFTKFIFKYFVRFITIINSLNFSMVIKSTALFVIKNLSLLLFYYIITCDIISLYHFSYILRFVLLLFFHSPLSYEAAQFLRKCIPPLQSSSR